MEIRPLQQGDSRSQFRSGDPHLDRFFHEFAGQNQFKHSVGVTYVAIEEGHIFGYATVAPGQIEIEELPASVRKNLPNYPAPILRLARLAVSESARGKGVGNMLLRFVLKLAVRMADEYGCIGVVVDAKPDAVDFYAKYLFIPLAVFEGQSEVRPLQRAMFLSVRVIKGAVRT